MKRIILISFLILTILIAACSDQTVPVENEGTITPESQGMDSEKLLSMLETVENLNKDFHSVLVFRNDVLVMETYSYPYQQEYKHVIHSSTKSITSALIGIAIEEGLINSVNDRIVDYFDDMEFDHMSAEKKAITIKDLLTMSAGLYWVDNMQYGAPDDSMAKMDMSTNAIEYVLDQHMTSKPGEKFYYHNGASLILSAIIQKQANETTFEYARKKLFEPLGIKDIEWPVNQNGITNGATGILMTPSDMGKIGLLYLNKGKWNGEQIVPESWVEESTKKWIETPNALPGQDGYGYQWWMNSFGGYSARGFGGQYIFVQPEQDLVVVFTGKMEGSDYFLPQQLMEKFIIPSIKSDKALPANKKANDKLNAYIEKLAKTDGSKEVQELPTIAKAISGKDFVLDEHPSMIKSFNLDFHSENEALLKLNYMDFEYEFHVGLDDVFRVSEPSNPEGPFGIHDMMAAKGRWIDDHTFQVQWLNAYQYELLFRFNGEEVELSILDLELTGRMKKGGE